MPGKTNFTLRVARHVIAGNPYISAYASQFNRHIDVIPTVVDTDVFRPACRHQQDPPVIGWIGTHSSLQYLRAIVPALRDLARRRKFVLRVVGATLEASDLNVDNRPWTIEREVDDFQGLDIGLYPLVKDDWSVGKSGFKAIQYLACGVPFVASPFGVTTSIIRNGDNGILASSHQEWVDQLEALLVNRYLRLRLGEVGRADAVAQWSTATHAPRFVRVISSAIQ
jgi:glycosyltransferase involved in cell wall biosynthesis